MGNCIPYSRIAVSPDVETNSRNNLQFLPILQIIESRICLPQKSGIFRDGIIDIRYDNLGFKKKKALLCSIEEIEKFIDLEKLIGSKNPKLLKRLPGFIIRYLKRILHQREVNQIIHENKDLVGVDFCHQLINRFQLDVVLKRIENAPKEGGVIFVCNHPLGGMDAIALVHRFHEYRPDMKFIVNDLLLNLKNLKGLFVGVNKHGATALRSLQNVDKLFNSDKAVFVFPAGLVSRKIDGKIQDVDWKKTFITRAKKYNQPIIPVYIEGRLSNFFYGFARFRERLGIKVNIEMLYLVNELFKQKKRRIEIRFGEAISPAELDKSKNDRQWAAEIRQRCYNLAE